MTISDIGLVNGVDLVGEVLTAAWNVRESHQDWLAAHGVGPVAIYGTPPRLHGHFGVTRAEFHGDFFEPSPDGKPVIVLACFEHPNEPPVDLVAFEPSNPGHWYLRLGNAVVLGLHNARLALFNEEPVLVHPEPLSWLKAQCQGCCVLDWQADILSLLEGYGVLAADKETGRKLEGAFRHHINVPQVKVMEAQRAVA